jgi:hypothetical protein
LCFIHTLLTFDLSLSDSFRKVKSFPTMTVGLA